MKIPRHRQRFFHLRVLALTLAFGLLPLGCGDTSSFTDATDGTTPTSPEELWTAVKSVEATIDRKIIVTFTEAMHRDAVEEALAAMADEAGVALAMERVHFTWRTRGENEQLVIHGPFQFGATYSASIPATVMTLAGVEIGEAASIAVTFPANPAAYEANDAQEGDILLFNGMGNNVIVLPYSMVPANGAPIFQSALGCGSGAICRPRITF